MGQYYGSKSSETASSETTPRRTFLISSVRLDNQHLSLHFIFEVGLISLLCLLIEFHFVDKFSSQGGDHILADSWGRSEEVSEETKTMCTEMNEKLTLYLKHLTFLLSSAIQYLPLVIPTYFWTFSLAGSLNQLMA